MRPASAFKRLLTPGLVLGLGGGTDAQVAGSETDTAAIRAAVLAALETEQSAFEARDCQTSVGYFADLLPLFVVSGRVMPSRAPGDPPTRQVVTKVWILRGGSW